MAMDLEPSSQMHPLHAMRVKTDVASATGAAVVNGEGKMAAWDVTPG